MPDLLIRYASRLTGVIMELVPDDPFDPWKPIETGGGDVLVPMIGSETDWIFYQNDEGDELAFHPDYPHRCPDGFERVVSEHRQPPPVIVKEFAVNHNGKPISNSLPRRKLNDGKGKLIAQEERLGGHTVFRHQDGGLTDDRGRPIVANRKDSERESARADLEHDR